MAQHRAGPAREYRPPSPSSLSHLRVSDGVDAAMESMQPPGADAPVDPGGAEPEPAQLLARDDATLPGGNRGDSPVVDDFASQSEGKSSTVRDSPPTR